MSEFSQIKNLPDTKTAIKNLFDLDLEISGGWGYEAEDAVLFKGSNLDKSHIFHTFAMIRSIIEMSILKDKEYSAINANLKEISNIKKDGKNYEFAKYKITAMKTEIYKSLIQEYKNSKFDENFDMNAHFNKRKENTITRDIICWFGIESN